MTENIWQILEKATQNFCTDLLRMLRFECPQKRKKNIFLNLDFGPDYLSDKIFGQT